jgi:hypothetical protein
VLFPWAAGVAKGRDMRHEVFSVPCFQQTAGLPGWPTWDSKFQRNTAKPLGDSAQYDVILDLGGRLVSVQIKSTYHGDSKATPGTYEASLLHACGPSGLYRARPTSRSPAKTYDPRLPWGQTQPMGAVPRSHGTFSKTAPPDRAASAAESTSTASSKIMWRRPK